MEVSTEKSKIMTKSMNISADISMNGQKLEEVTSFKYLGATLCKDGTCSAEVLIRIAIAMARLKRIWQCNITSLTSQFKLYKSLVTSILFYGCETWTLLIDSEKRIQAIKTKCFRKLLCISYLDHKASTRYGARSTPLWFHRNLFLQLARDRNWHGSGMSHATTASRKPSFRASWRLGNAVIVRENVGLTTSKSGYSCPYQNYSQGPPPEKTGRGSLLNYPQCPPPPHQ